MNLGKSVDRSAYRKLLQDGREGEMEGGREGGKGGTVHLRLTS